MTTENQKILSNKEVNKEIMRRNRIFSNKTAAQKRVAVAKDVLKQVKFGRITPTFGVYINKYAVFDRDPQESLQSLILSNQVSDCHCCGIGACFLSYTLFENQANVGDIEDITKTLAKVNLSEEIYFKNNFHKIFPKKILTEIEAAFEQWGDYEVIGYSSSQERIEIIMKNIIKHRGNFNKKAYLKAMEKI